MKKLQLSQNAQDWLWSILAAIAIAMCVFFYTPHTHAQNVRLEGKTFIQQSSVGDSIATGYYYQDQQGYKYPVYLSSKGKAYCWLKSKKTGKMYKRYLPKITEELNRIEHDRRSH